MRKASLFGLAAWSFVGVVVGAELGAVDPNELRARAREAFARGDYEAMAKAYQPVVAGAMQRLDGALGERDRRRALRMDECLDDSLGLGHAHQLAGNWGAAVAAYQTALRAIEAVLKAGPATEGGQLVRGAVRNNHERDYARLVRLIGCIQREELKDPQAAATTLAKATDFCPLLKSSADELADHYLKRLRDFTANKQMARDFAFESATRYPRQALRELAITREQLGQVQAAIETWSKVNLTRAFVRGAGVIRAETGPLHALVQKFPTGQAAPRIPGLLTLTPGARTLTLNMDDPHTWALSCGWWGSRDSDYWQFALVPPRGQEFAALEFACDIEQIDPRYGGHFKCWARTTGEEAGTVNIGSISWRREPAGRAVLTQKFDVPPGAGVVFILVGVAPGKFKVHRVATKATFRPWEDLALRPKGIQPKADVWMQSECLPPGGTLTRNGQEIQPGTATTGMRPGHYAFIYKAPAHPETYRCEVDFAPGGRYGLFINLDSPFRWKLTNLRGFGQHPPSRASLVRMANGRWLVAYGSRHLKLLLSTSADGVTWDKPRPLPHGKLFDNIEPTLHLDRKGTVWLAYFSNRLTWPPATTGGFQLWLTRSRDGREWSRPRPVLVTLPRIRTAFWREFGTIAGKPCGAAQLVEGPKGRHWLFWRNYVACADTPENIRQFQPIAFEGGAKPRIRTAHPVIDPAGRLHMVLNTWREGLCYSTSADGQQWSSPRALAVGKARAHLTGAQLILDGTRAALIYETLGGAWLCRGTVEPAPKFGPPIKITNHVIPPCGSRACVTPDGRVTLLVGKNSAWLLWADRNTLSRPVHKF